MKTFLSWLVSFPGNKKFPRLPGNDGDMDAYNQECYKYLYSFILENKQFKW